jgi:tRNA(Arg) A34 adenosine deaminase TadA
VQFRWVQPLGNELRSGLQLSSNARTAHAERLIASRAAQTYDLAFLARCTLYTSAEPCATCAARSIGQELAASSVAEREGAQRADRRAPSICPAASFRRRSTADRLGPLLEDKAARLQADFGKRGDSRFSRPAIWRLVRPRASEKNRLRQNFVLAPQLRDLSISTH